MNFFSKQNKHNVLLTGPLLLKHVNPGGASGNLRFHLTGSTDRCHHHVAFSLTRAELEQPPSKTPQGKLIQSATQPTPTQPLCVRDGIAVFPALPRTGDASRKTADRLFCVDTNSGAQLGIAYIGAYNDLSTLEVTDCCISADGTYVAMVINMTSNYGNNSSRVVVYEATSWREVYMLTVNGGKRAVALDFHPRFENSRLSVAYHMNADYCVSVSSYDMPRHRTERCETVNFSSDVDDGSHTLAYSKGGAFIVMQLISALWRSQESFCETLVIDSETLRVLYRCEPTFVWLCHNECLSVVRPTFSECGDYFALCSCDDSNKDAPNTRVFRLPVTVQLGAQCRVAILKCLTDSNDVKTLPLPEKLKEYILFSPDYT